MRPEPLSDCVPDADANAVVVGVWKHVAVRDVFGVANAVCDRDPERLSDELDIADNVGLRVPFDVDDAVAVAKPSDALADVVCDAVHLGDALFHAV